MKNPRSPVSLLVSLGLLMGTVGCAHMHCQKCEIQKKVHLAGETKILADQAIYTALQKVQGTVVEAELEEEENHKAIWEVEIVTADDKLIEVKIDAKTGEVLDVEEEKAD